MIEFEFTKDEIRLVIQRFKEGDHPKSIARELTTRNILASELDVLDIIRDKINAV